MSSFTIKGGFLGLAVSSRVRLARNLKGYPFRTTDAQRAEIAGKVLAALQTSPVGAEFTKTEIIPRSTEAAALIERHLISPALAQTGGWVLVSGDGGVSIMIGEEDHLRLQVIGSGLCPKECLETATRLASLIETQLPFAYDERLGYLTACPTNLGTGLRASIMLHLPVLAGSDQLGQIMSFAGRNGCTVRGAYGEGSEAAGGFYQLSNQITLGASADDLTDKLIATATSVLDAEKKARERLRTANEPALRDRVCRAAGTMQSAYLMQTGEAIGVLSDVLIGLQMGYLTGVTPEALYALEQQVHPALLGGAPQERDEKRAKLLRDAAKALKLN